MIEGDPDLAGQQRLRHKAVVRRIRVDTLPQSRELDPHGLGFRRTKRPDNSAGEGRVQKAFKEAMHEPLRSGREAEQALARVFMKVIGPCGELVVGEAIDIRFCWQITERLLVGDHDVAGLHPRNVELMGGAEFAERYQFSRDGAGSAITHEIIERQQGVEREKRLQLCMQRANDIGV